MRLPSKRDLRGATREQLERLAAAIDAEQWRREEAEAAARDEEQRRAEVGRLEELARTVVKSRYTHQLVRCGKVHCHCMKGGATHGHYWYRIDTYGDGRRKKAYVGKKLPKGVKTPNRARPAPKRSGKAPSVKQRAGTSRVAARRRA